jgi:MORN repeat
MKCYNIFNSASSDRAIGCWHGNGRTSYSNGDSYQGEFKFGHKHGRGIYSWHDGRVYDGMFHEDKIHGAVCSCHFITQFLVFQEKRSTSNRDFLGVTPFASNMSPPLVHLFLVEIYLSSHRVSTSGPVMPFTMATLSMDKGRAKASISIVVAANTMVPGKLVNATGLGT